MVMTLKSCHLEKCYIYHNTGGGGVSMGDWLTVYLIKSCYDDSLSLKLINIVQGVVNLQRHLRQMIR